MMAGDQTKQPTDGDLQDQRLTPLGRTLLGPVDVLADWAAEHRETVRSNRRRYDTEHTSDPPDSDASDISEL